ncbi:MULTISPECIES: hypothetical protein [Metabacillus]|uniref:DUF4064 domain-containing protein n=2 Tax=Metabacillus TaxID=2675233 RepID=A0A179T2G6_9BACI|nr:MULTISPECIES: hypothetical protein [Metabacillus]OAS87628.1 hypothetical protein A6K24_19490 [Metabacillus litoralis]QNF26974.1 hypothetical protein HUW50_05095 [Metabacillus sp. KUDC1714]
MKRTRKSPLLWIGIAILGLIVLTIILNVIGHLATVHQHMEYGRGSVFHHGSAGFRNNINMFDFSLLPFLVSIGLIALGWWIWKKADGESVKKWVGIFLLTVGLFSILPLIIAIPVLLLAFYLAFKQKKAGTDFIDEPIMVTSPSYHTTTHDILDNWERKTNKENDK